MPRVVFSLMTIKSSNGILSCQQRQEGPAEDSVRAPHIEICFAILHIKSISKDPGPHEDRIKKHPEWGKKYETHQHPRKKIYKKSTSISYNLLKYPHPHQLATSTYGSHAVLCAVLLSV